MSMATREMEATIRRLAVEQVAREVFGCAYPQPFPAHAALAYEAIMEIRRRCALIGIKVKTS